MRKHAVWLAAVVALAGCALLPGSRLRRAQIRRPKAAEDLQYLGLAGTDAFFTLGDIEAEVVLVSVVEGYCYKCQKAAPGVNGLYRVIADAGLSPKIKVLGIAAGNSPDVAGLFRRRYQIPFPVVADEFSQTRYALKVPRMPYLLAVKQKTFGPAVILSEYGGIEDPKAFLDKVLVAAGMKDKPVEQEEEKKGKEKEEQREEKEQREQKE